MGKGAEPQTEVPQPLPVKIPLLFEGENGIKQETATNPKIIFLQSKITYFHLVAVIVVMTIVILALGITLGVKQENTCHRNPTEGAHKNPGPVERAPIPPPCDEGWIWYSNKCYFFSEVKENWTLANDTCASLQASLVVIDSLTEKDILLRFKGPLDHWIGLTRDSDKTWKWVDGTEFNNLFPINGVSDFAYLNHEDVKTSECHTKRRWICRKIPNYEAKRRKRSLSVQHFY